MTATVAAPAHPVVLVIMDGVGIGQGDAFDCVTLAHTPELDKLTAEGSYRTLRAHGTAVGLPSDNDMGNSEVGHNIMGAGRISPQGASQVADALATGRIWDTATWADITEACTNGGTLHLIGLLSDGGVHSHIDHVIALAYAASQAGARRIRIHALLDGRDVPQGSAETYISDLNTALADLTDIDIAYASGGGRMVTTMDRYDADWAVVEAGWKAHVLGTAHPVASIAEGVAWGRSTQGEKDQYLPAFTIVDAHGEPAGAIHDGDAVVLFNFRGDRAIELAQAFEAGPEFTRFERERVPRVTFAGMTQYDGDTNTPRRYLVEPAVVGGVMSELLADAGLRQWAGAETQKYGHVTYFWNGNRSGKFDENLEEYLEVPSDLVPFDERPWMKSAEVADAVIDAVNSERYDFIRVNFAAGDMVGHTGDLAATRMAVEAVDLAIGRIRKATDAKGAVLVITADHGNADDMVERSSDGTPETTQTGDPRLRTAHSLSPVPLIIHATTGPTPRLRDDLPDAGLANLAATLLELLGQHVPDEYEPSLLAP
jgi:2,3-bisphosphoglycerate-independent phosphoglycerate mutase